MECRQCNNKEMDKEIYEGVEIDVCSGCGGIWLDKGELEKVISIREKRFDQEMIDEVSELTRESRGMFIAERGRNLPCCVCGAAMDQANYQYSSNIIIDRCPEGHGVWLDPGELEKIQIHQESWTDELEKNRGKYAKLSGQVGAMAKTSYEESAKINWSRSKLVNSLLNGVLKLN